jgi:hypothetical protein
MRNDCCSPEWDLQEEFSRHILSKGCFQLEYLLTCPLLQHWPSCCGTNHRKGLGSHKRTVAQRGSRLARNSTGCPWIVLGGYVTVF